MPPEGSSGSGAGGGAVTFDDVLAFGGSEFSSGSCLAYGSSPERDTGQKGKTVLLNLILTKKKLRCLQISSILHALCSF